MGGRRRGSGGVLETVLQLQLNCAVKRQLGAISSRQFPTQTERPPRPSPKLAKSC